MSDRLTARSVTLRGEWVLVHAGDRAGWEALRDHGASLEGEFDPHAGEGRVRFPSRDVARAVAIELVLDGYLEAR